MESKLLTLLMEKEEITWQSLLYNIIKTENMDPWDIDVSKLTKLYIQTIKELKEFDLRISGKVILAAAILLKIKSTKLVGDNISELDRLFSSLEETSVEEIDDFYEGLSLNFNEHNKNALNIPALVPKTPQPRKRKVSLKELMKALEKALEVRDRRIQRRIINVEIKIPEKKIDMTKIINNVYKKIINLFKINNRVTFDSLLESNDKSEKIFTFIPLLHLSHVDERKIDLIQEQPFGEIEIVLCKAQTNQEIKNEIS
ncbi:MAG: segregation/condensation protein A [Candidatus Woesearchaeota archaeon]